MKEATVPLKDGRMFYRSMGQGEPLVLIHSIGLSSELWGKVIEPLSNKFYIFALDLIGHGDSDKPDLNYEVQDHARSVSEFMDTLGIEKARVMGGSMGGLIALELAAAFPEKVLKQVLIGTPVLNEPLWSRLEFLMRIAVARYDLEGNPKPLSVEDLKVYYVNPTEETVKWSNRIRGKAGKWCQKDQLTVVLYEVMPRLPLVKCPTLVVYGSNDVGVAGASVLAENIEGAKSIVLEGLNHFPQFDNPEELLQPVMEFL